MNKVNKSHDRNLSPPTQKSSIIIRMIRVIRGRYSLRIRLIRRILFRLFSVLFRFFRYKIYSRQSPRELSLSKTEETEK
jgi:hypothetical protein